MLLTFHHSIVVVVGVMVDPSRLLGIAQKDHMDGKPKKGICCGYFRTTFSIIRRQRVIVGIDQSANEE